jgi:drug/metabolite transporter (DMT)-like permease
MTTARKEVLDGVAIGSMLLCALLWGLGQVAAKVAVAEMPPLSQAALRSLLAALLVGLWSRSRGDPLFDRDGSLRGGLLAGALFAAEFACIFIGLQYTTASRMIVFIYLAPFVVARGMPFIARSERLMPAQTLGLLLAFAGVAWAFAEGFTRPAAGAQQWLGDALGVLAALLWGATTLVIRGSRLASVSAQKTLFYQLAVSGVALALAASLTGEAWPAHASASSWAAFIFQVVIVSFASYLLWFWLVRHYPATRLAAFTLLTPLFGLLFGVLLLGEPATARLLLALAAVAVGIVLVNRRG